MIRHFMKQALHRNRGVSQRNIWPLAPAFWGGVLIVFGAATAVAQPTCKGSLWKFGTPTDSAETLDFPVNQPASDSGLMATQDFPKSSWTFQVRIAKNGHDINLSALKTNHLAAGELMASNMTGAFDSNGQASSTTFITSEQGIWRAKLDCQQ